MSSKTDAAFAKFRGEYPLREMRFAPRNEDEVAEMTSDLDFWADGPGTAKQGQPPELNGTPANLMLWAVRDVDVVCGMERCTFGSTLKNGVIKHSNLTAGRKAHCAGELVFLDEDVLALNGASGRYGPESMNEMDAVAKAFKDSGYGVWNYGYDEEANSPFRFGARLPDWVE